jgi:hypothetical protein
MHGCMAAYVGEGVSCRRADLMDPGLYPFVWKRVGLAEQTCRTRRSSAEATRSPAFRIQRT